MLCNADSPASSLSLWRVKVEWQGEQGELLLTVQQEQTEIKKGHEKDNHLHHSQLICYPFTICVCCIL